MTVTKSTRQRLMIELVRERPIHTQDELVVALRERGWEVTQATVSRDLREMGLVRVADARSARYVAEVGDVDLTGTVGRLAAVLRDHVRSLEFVGSVGVVKARPSTAPMVAAALDAARFDEIAGTVAGDDTVLVIARGEAAAPTLETRLRAMMGGVDREETQ